MPHDEQTEQATPAVTALDLELWRLLREEVGEHAEGRAALERWLAAREAARPAVAGVVERFASGEIGVEAFREALERGEREAAHAFGFDGLSGARFLNKLLAVTGAGELLSPQLRGAVQLPHDPGVARDQLRGFVALLRALAGGRRLSARDLQPARAAFFVSLCWHVQRPEEWPAFHLPVRRALVRQGGLRPPSGDPAGDYLAFRERFLALTDTLAVGSWELEYLCRWQHTRAAEDGEEPYLYPSAPRSRGPSGMRVEPPLTSVREPTGASPANAPAVLPTGATAPASAPRGEPRAGPGDDAPGERLGHTHVQWLLATLGRSLGCRVWVAPNDRGRAWHGDSLGALSVRHFPPLAVDAPSRRLIELIDVVWLQGSNRVVAAFEVEHTTSVYSGLLRLADLAAVCPNLSFPLYVVAPDARLDKVRRELARPAFQALGLHARCGFFSSETLLDGADGMARWATSPAAIDRLAERVGDRPGEERAG